MKFPTLIEWALMISMVAVATVCAVVVIHYGNLP